jgi:hypothetical protein
MMTGTRQNSVKNSFIKFFEYLSIYGSIYDDDLNFMIHATYTTKYDDDDDDDDARQHSLPTTTITTQNCISIIQQGIFDEPLKFV